MRAHAVAAIAGAGLLSLVPAAAGAFDPLFSLCLADRPPTSPASLWAAWSLAPEVVAPLALLLLVHLRGLARLPAGAGRPRSWRTLCFALGWLALAGAVVSPLCRMAATLASAHMAQHVLLVAVAPPLLLLGMRGPVWRAGLPARLAAAASALLRRLGSPLIAGTLYGAAIWFWHVPAFYEAALIGEGVHLLMYGTLLGVSLLFWRSLFVGVDDLAGAHAGAALSSFATAVHTGLLGALLTFASQPWYPLLAPRAVVWRLSPLEDQQLAGLIMWIPMGAIYLAAGLALFAAFLGGAARQGAAAPAAQSPM